MRQNVPWILRGIGAGIFALSVLCSGPSPISAQEALPPKAEKAMQRGLAAAKQQEWGIAVRYFAEAWEAASRAPEVLFNLALAHDRLGGRELLAIAWFRAFLAAAPEAASAKQVRERIFELEVKVEANAAKLIAKAKEAAARLPDEDESSAMAIIASAQAKTGDVAGAKDTAVRISDDMPRSYAYREIAVAQAEAGDFAGAKAMAAEIPNLPNGWHDIAQVDIAEAQAKAGDIAGAMATAARILLHYYRSLAYRYIARAQAKAGDSAGALDALDRAEEAAARVTDDGGSTLSEVYAAIAEAQMKAGGDEAGGDEEIARKPYVRKEEIDAWTKLMGSYYLLDEPAFQDLQGFIRSLTVKEPGDMVDGLAEAAVDLAEAMRQLQKEDAEWRAKQAEAQ